MMIVLSRSFHPSFSLAADVDRAFSQRMLDSKKKKKNLKKKAEQDCFLLLVHFRASKTRDQKPVFAFQE